MEIRRGGCTYEVEDVTVIFASLIRGQQKLVLCFSNTNLIRGQQSPIIHGIVFLLMSLEAHRNSLSATHKKELVP